MIKRHIASNTFIKSGLDLLLNKRKTPNNKAWYMIKIPMISINSNDTL